MSSLFQFMPHSKNGLIASSAGDGKVKIHRVERSGTSTVSDPSFQCVCHTNRVKRLATAPDMPYLLWSGSEDGTCM